MIPFSMASTFTVASSAESISVPAGSSGYFEFNITSDADDVFSVTVDGRPWTTVDNIRPVSKARVPETMMLYAKPGIDVAPGVYKIDIIFKSLTTDLQIEKRMYVTVSREKKVAIEKITVSGSLEPAGRVEITTYIRNFEDVTVTNVVVKGDVRSPEAKIASIHEVVNEIDPGQSIELKRVLVLPAQAEAGKYRIGIEMSYSNRTESYAQLFIVTSKEQFEKTVSDFLVFLGYGRLITIENKGNLPGSISVHDQAGWFYAGPAPDKNEGNTYYWELRDIQPGEKRSIRYEINYVPLLVLIIILAIVIWALMFKIRTIRIRKFIMQRKHIREGTEFTVGIDIRNSSGRAAKDVVIMDFVPPVFTVKDAEGVKPQKRKGHAGTHLTWKFDEIGKHEERVLVYKIVPLIGVHGEVGLPKAHVRFKSGAAQRKNSSLFATIGVPVEKPGKRE